jgi:hypothetical protein
MSSKCLTGLPFYIFQCHVCLIVGFGLLRRDREIVRNCLHPLTLGYGCTASFNRCLGTALRVVYGAIRSLTRRRVRFIDLNDQQRRGCRRIILVTTIDTHCTVSMM